MISAWTASISPSSVSWSMPVRCRTPWTTASSRSTVCSGQITTSPSSRGPNGSPSSSTGNESTSVGPALPRCAALSSAIRSASTNAIATWPSSMPADPRAIAASSCTRACGSSSPSTSTSSTARRRRPDPGRRPLGVLGVGLDDPLHDLVAHDVLVAEVDHADAVHAAQDLADLDESRALVAREVDLRDVAVDDHLGAEPEAGQEHLHLLGRRVLRLVEDDEGVVERAAAHERERRHFDDAL